MPIRIEDLPMKYREQIARKQLAQLRAKNGNAANQPAAELSEKLERQRRAAQSNAEGHSFEQEIVKACLWYSGTGRARIDKTPERFRVTRLTGNGHFEGRFTGKAQVDFSGTLSGGRSIKFDAKYTEKDRIMQSALTKYQTEELEESHALGAYCGVCVGMKNGAYFVPWETWARMKELFGRKYMTIPELEPYRLSFNIHSWALFLDYDKNDREG